MRRIFMALGTIMLTLMVSAPCFALSIGLDSVVTEVAVGDLLSIDLTISGLGDGMALSLSVFDIDVVYDPSIVGLNGSVYGGQLDIFSLGDIQITTTGADYVNLYEVSFDLPDDLDDFQMGDFVLATLTFEALAEGTTPLDLNVNVLGDSWGMELVPDDVTGAAVSVRPVQVPEPSSLMLLGIGLFGLVTYRRRVS